MRVVVCVVDIFFDDDNGDSEDKDDSEDEFECIEGRVQIHL